MNTEKSIGTIDLFFEVKDYIRYSTKVQRPTPIVIIMKENESKGAKNHRLSDAELGSGRAFLTSTLHLESAR